MNSFHQRKRLEQGGDIDDKIAIYEKDRKEDIQGAIRSAFQLYKSMERSISERVETLQKSIDDGYSDELGRTELKFLKKQSP